MRFKDPNDAVLGVDNDADMDGRHLRAMVKNLREDKTHGEYPLLFADKNTRPTEDAALWESEFDREVQVIQMNMQRHARATHTALLNRFPDVDLIHNFHVLSPRAYEKVDKIYTDGLLGTFGLNEIEALVQHYGVCKTAEDGVVHKALVHATYVLDEFEHFKTYMHSGINCEGDKSTVWQVSPDGEREVMAFSVWFLIHGPTIKLQFPYLFCLMQIAAIIPMTSVAPERGFSAMNQVKSKLRNRISDFLLDCLLRLKTSKYTLSVAAFRETFVTKAVQRFQRMKKRRSSKAQAGETMEKPEICIDGSDYDENFDDAVSDA